MDVASLCPFPVGIVRWRAPGPALTTVVKATFRLVPDGEAVLASAQEPLSIDVLAPIVGGDALREASDFVPLKGAADVLLVGHVRSSIPTPVIPARLAVAGLDRHVFAVRSPPAREVSLTSVHVRTEPRMERAVGDDGTGALVARRRRRAHRSARRGILADLPESFDYTRFCAAPKEQRVVVIPEDAAIQLEGLVAGALRTTTRLPGLRPRLWATWSGAASPTEVQLFCDTLWIDVDRSLVTLTWRGALDLEGCGEPTLLVLAPQRRGERLSWASVAPRVPEAQRGRAMTLAEAISAREPDDGDGSKTTRLVLRALKAPAPVAAPAPAPAAAPALAVAPAPEPADDATISMAVLDEGSQVITLGDDELLDVESEGDEAPTLPPPMWDDQTSAVDLARAAHAPLPFPSAPRLPQLPWVEEATTQISLGAVQPELLQGEDATGMLDVARLGRAVLPFSAGEAAATAPAPQARPPRRERTGTLDLVVDRSMQSMPFAPSAPPRPPAPSEASGWSGEPVPPPRVEAPPPAAEIDPDADPPTPPRRLGLASFAEIKADMMWADDGTQSVVLARHGVSEAAWVEAERAHAQGAGDAVALHAAMRSAEEQLARKAAPAAGPAASFDPGESIDDYATLRAEVEDAADPEPVLARRGLTSASFRRLTLGWREKALRDGAVAESLRRKLAAARTTR